MINLIKTKPHYIIVGFAFVLAFFTNDVAYNFGRLFTISLISLALADWLGNKYAPSKSVLIKLIASLFPLFVIGMQLTNEYSQRQSISSIKQSLSDQKEIYRSALLDENTKSQPYVDRPLDFSQFKPAHSREDLYKQLSELLKVANQYSVNSTYQQKKLLAEIEWANSIAPEKLTSLSDSIKLREKAARYQVFLNTSIEIFNKFKDDYRNSFYIIAKAYPDEIKGFESSYQKSLKSSEEFTNVQIELTKEIMKLSNLLEDGYRRNTIQYSHSQKNLVFSDGAQLHRYNQIIENLNRLSRLEEEILKGKYETLQSMEKKLSR